MHLNQQGVQSIGGAIGHAFFKDLILPGRAGPAGPVSDQDVPADGGRPLHRQTQWGMRTGSEAGWSSVGSCSIQDGTMRTACW